MLSRDLVGRDAELAALRDAWQRAGTTVLVRGPAGIGKTRLVRELTSWARTKGGTVLIGRCSATSSDTPLRALRESLLGAARTGIRPGPAMDAFVPALGAVVPEWRTGVAAADTSGLVLGEGVLRLLSSQAHDAIPAMLVIEDLQWADAETLEVVEYLADNVATTPALVLATVRDGEPGAGTTLAAALAARRAATELAVHPLDAEGVLAVARSCLDGAEVPAAVSGGLIERTEGVPFLVEELLATAVASGWDTIAASVPGSVVSSVELRLAALPPSAADLLRHAAVLGRQFDWRIAATAAGIAEEDAPELLRLAARAQLVDVEGAGFRFRHALTADAVLSGAGPAVEARIAGHLLDALETFDAALEGERCQLAAALAERAGLREQAGGFLSRAARRALDDGQLGSADALAARAQPLLTGDGRDDVDELLLEVCCLTGQTERARQLGDRLLDARPDPHRRAEVHLRLGRSALAAGRWDEADAHAGSVRSLVPGDGTALARADAVGALAALGRDDVDSAATLAEAALGGAETTNQPDVQCEALEVLGRIRRGDDVAAGEAAFQEALDVATAAGLAVWRVRALQELGTIDMFETLANERLEAARRSAVEVGALSLAAVVDLQLAALYDERGELGAAMAAAQRCEDASRRWGLATLPMSLGLQAMVLARRGDRAGMDAAFAAALATGEDTETVTMNVLINATAVLHIVEGDLEAAARAGDASMEAHRRRPGAVAPFPGLWALVRTVLDDGGDAARAETAAQPFDTPLSHALLKAADAVAAGRSDPRAATELFAAADAALARQAGGFRRALARMLVAPAAAGDGWGEPVEWLRESLAVFEERGLDAFARRCRAVLRDVGAPVPRRGREDAGAVPPTLAALGITSREAEVLALVAAGGTNRQVAEQLVISLRTVDKHVERVLAKTGTTRAGLADVAHEAGLLRT